MPVWAFAYVLLLLLMTAASTTLKRRIGFPWWWVMLDTLSMTVLLWLFIAYYRADALGVLHRAALVILAGAVLWMGISTHRELRVVEAFPLLRTESGAGMQWASLLGGVILLTPALGLGAIAAMRGWQGS